MPQDERVSVSITAEVSGVPANYPWPTTDDERESYRDWLEAVANQETTQGWRAWAAEQEVTTTTTCRHCGRAIGQDAEGAWVDPEATSDDRVWRETCDQHDTFEADHEPVTHLCDEECGDETHPRDGRTVTL